MGLTKQSRGKYAKLPEADQQSCDEHITSRSLRTHQDRRKGIFYFGCFLSGIATGALLLKMFQDLPLLADLGSPQAKLEKLLRSTLSSSMSPFLIFIYDSI